MSYVGKWVFHSIGMVNDSDEVVFLSAEEYLKAPITVFYHGKDEIYISIKGLLRECSGHRAF